MPFDLTSSNETSDLIAQISTLRKEAATLSRLQVFSAWKITKGRGGTAYRVFKTRQGHKHKSDEYFLSGLVLQGGGTLGLAHAGLIHGLELGGLRFCGVAGTSAGAIVAAGMFAIRGRDILRPVGPDITKLVESVPMDSFVDGPRPVRRFIKHFAAKRDVRRLIHLSAIRPMINATLRHRGLNSGATFERWVTALLESHGIKTLDDLEELSRQVAQDLRAATPKKTNPFEKAGKGFDSNSVLKLITTAMPVGAKFVLPRDLEYLSADYQQISPARMVRMSMSIPMFFEPIRMTTNKAKWPDYIGNSVADFVSDRTALQLSELKELTFLDGGLFSNLPTDEMVRGLPEQMSSISAPLVADGDVSTSRSTTLKALMKEGAAVFAAMKMQRDRDAHEHPDMQADHRKILKVDTAKAHWLNFNMSPDEKTQLYLAGLRRARDFFLTGD